MRPEFEQIFRLFPEEILIIGSAVRDYQTARDIDILFESEADFKRAIKRLGATYNGWDQFSRTPSGAEVKSHIRRANVSLKGIAKPVQLLHSGLPHPYAACCRDGTYINEHVHFDKSKPTRYR